MIPNSICHHLILCILFIYLCFYSLVYASMGKWLCFPNSLINKNIKGKPVRETSATTVEESYSRPCKWEWRNNYHLQNWEMATFSEYFASDSMKDSMKLKYTISNFGFVSINNIFIIFSYVSLLFFCYYRLCPWTCWAKILGSNSDLSGHHWATSFHHCSGSCFRLL